MLSKIRRLPKIRRLAFAIDCNPPAAVAHLRLVALSAALCCVSKKVMSGALSWIRAASRDVFPTVKDVMDAVNMDAFDAGKGGVKGGANDNTTNRHLSATRTTGTAAAGRFRAGRWPLPLRRLPASYRPRLPAAP